MENGIGMRTHMKYFPKLGTKWEVCSDYNYVKKKRCIEENKPLW